MWMSLLKISSHGDKKLVILNLAKNLLFDAHCLDCKLKEAVLLWGQHSGAVVSIVASHVLPVHE